MSANDCRTVQRHLSAYFDGELPAEQSASVAEHVASCDACTAELSSFESLKSLVGQSSVPLKPADLWQRIEQHLRQQSKPATLSRRSGGWLPQSPYRAGLVSLAASMLLLLGAALWYHGGEREQRNCGGAMHSHDGEQEMSAAHMAEFAGVMDDYLQKLPLDPEGAEQLLLTKYDGERVDADAAVSLVGYRPIISGGLPHGYSLASTSVLKMPCCTCVKAVCRRSDGSILVLFEHDDEAAAWFGDRTSTLAMCGDKHCCLVDLDSSIAATWQQGTRSVTAVGVRNQAEEATLANWLGGARASVE